MTPSILLVEHLRHAAADIDCLLTQQGYKVRTVLSATQALAAWYECPADVVLYRVTFAESVNGLDVAHTLEASGAVVILYSPLPADLLQEIPGFSTTSILYIDTRRGFADLLKAVQGFAELRAKRENHIR